MARTPKCMCKDCNTIGTVKIEIAKRGNRYGYMCERHANDEQSYFAENRYRHGNRKMNGFTYSQELETSFSNKKARGELLDFGFIATEDGTVDVEYKSPIFEGLNAMSKQLVSIEKLMNEGNLSIDYTCGTHLHVGHAEHINVVTMGYIRRFYHSLFIPLSNEIEKDSEKANEFFGRGFNNWAKPINANTDPMEHRNFINMEHDNTIEFRICKFQNASQYMNVVKFCRDVVNAVINNFVEHFNDTDFDTTRYATQTEYRKHKASVTANKLVKLYQKYTENI